MERAAYPHCDSRVLHAPGECVYCDLYPERQQARTDQGVNFTGHYDADKQLCPAEIERPLTTINRWGGNVAMTPELIAERDAEWAEVRARFAALEYDK